MLSFYRVIERVKGDSISAKMQIFNFAILFGTLKTFFLIMLKGRITQQQLSPSPLLNAEAFMVIKFQL